MVAAMCDKFGDKILHDKKEMMAFIKVSMERCLNYDDEKQSSDLKTEMLNTSLAILSLILNIKVCVLFPGMIVVPFSVHSVK